MKKLFLSILLVLLIPGLPMAATYDLSLGVPATTGTTTAPNGGTSPFMVDNSSGSYDLYPQLARTYAYGFQLTSLSPSDAALAAGNWSGVTLSVFVKFKSESDNVPWEAVEPNYLFKGIPADSSVTPQVRWVNVPPADRARVYFVSEGSTTPFGKASGKLIASDIPMQSKEPIIVIKEGTFTMPANGSGVSTFTPESIGAFPPGAQYAEFSVSGSSRFYTVDGVSTPSAAGNGTGKNVADLNGFSLTGAEAKNIKIAPSPVAGNVHYELMSAKP